MPRSKPKNQPIVDRREILIGSVALAAPVVVPAAADASSEPDQTEQSLEYRETEHIRQFYAKCRY